MAPNPMSWRLIGFPGNFAARIIFDGQGKPVLIVESYPDQAVVDNPAVGLPLGSNSDIWFRMQRDVSTRVLSLEMWAADGSGYRVAQTKLASMATALNLGSFTIGKESISNVGSLDARWSSVRVWDNTVPVGSMPPQASGDKGNLYNFTLDGSLVDSSGNKRDLVALGGAGASISYYPVAVVPPHCDAGAEQIVRAGDPVVLDGTGSYSTGGTGLVYSWRSTGTLPVQLSNASGSKASFSTNAAGRYEFELSVTDGSSVQSKCQTAATLIAADPKYNVVIQNDAHRRILGALSMYGKNPWPWYDDRQRAMLDWLTSALSTGFQDYWNKPAPGTIAVAAGSPTVSGTGTIFQTTFCGGPGRTVPLDTYSIVIWYPSQLYPGSTGRRAYPVLRCDSDTQLTMGRTSDGPWPYSVIAGDNAAGSGLQYTMSNDSLYGTFGYSAAPANYYDNVMALYVMYYKTGNTKYLQAARALADRWWSFLPVDRGNAYIPDRGAWIFAEPRSVALTGLIMRALDGRPEMWPGIRRVINFYAWNGAVDSSRPVQDLRNDGYVLYWLSLAAMFDPDMSQRAQYMQQVSTSITGKWTKYRQADGSWLMRSGGFGNTGNIGQWTVFTGKANVQSGSTAVAGTGTNFRAGSSGAPYCNTGDFIWFTESEEVYTTTGGIAGDRTAYPIAAINSDSSITLGAPYTGVSGAKNFACGGFLGAGVQPFMLAISSMGLYWAHTALSTDSAQTQAATLAKQYSVGAAKWLISTGVDSSTGGLWNGRTYPDCTGTVIHPACRTADPESARILLADVVGALSAAYTLSGDATIAAAADKFFTAMFAKPGTSGPVGDGVYLAPMNDGGYMFNPSSPLYIPKWIGMVFGVGGTWSWPGTRAAASIMPVTTSPNTKH